MALRSFWEKISGFGVGVVKAIGMRLSVSSQLGPMQG